MKVILLVCCDVVIVKFQANYSTNLIFVIIINLVLTSQSYKHKCTFNYMQCKPEVYTYWFEFSSLSVSFYYHTSLQS